MLKSMGFSQKIAFAARAERSISSAWVSVVEQIITRSTAGSSRMVVHRNHRGAVRLPKLRSAAFS
jgi:hypothetical protein